MKNSTNIIKKIWIWLGEYQKYIVSISSIASTIIVFLIGYQLIQSYWYKKYDNFLEFGRLYNEWYYSMPTEISNNVNTPYNSLNEMSKAWVRKYFSLYSLEFYFYKEKMIPAEMWEDLINGCKNGRPRAAFNNFLRFPILLEGYCVWKVENDGIGFTDEFITMLDKELTNCSINIEQMCQSKN